MVETRGGFGRLRLVGPSLVLLLALASCGSDGTESEGAAATSEVGDRAPTGDVAAVGGCALISVDEVATITGEEIMGATEMPTGCQWTVSADGASYDWQSFPAQVYRENRDLAAEGGLVEAVDGLGDEAFLRLQADGEGTVVNGETWVLLGDNAFQVRTGLLVWSDDILAAQRELAELIEQRL